MLVNLLPHNVDAGGGPSCQQPIVSRYCSSTQIDLLTPQKGRAKVLLSQVLKIYRPELSLGQMQWTDTEENIDEVPVFHEQYKIPELAGVELGFLEGEKSEEKFLEDAFFVGPQCYAGGSFTNLAQYYRGLSISGLDRETVRYLALLRLLLIQDCVLDTDAYMESDKTKAHLKKIKEGEGKGWFDYIKAAAFYHDGFFPEAADLFANIAREENEAGRKSGWLVETTRYMEVLSLFHKGREGQDEVFLPTVFNSFTEAFVTDFPRSEYRKHVEDMAVGIWLHYDDRERYYKELIQRLTRSRILSDRTAEIDYLDELSINALMANIQELADYPIEHGNGFTLLPAILSKAGDVSRLCEQAKNLPQETPADLISYIEMSCAYLLEGTTPDSSAFVDTPLFVHAKAFEVQALILSGKLKQEGDVIAEIALGLEPPLKDLLGLRSLQLEARLKLNVPEEFIASDKIRGSNKPMELSIMDAVLYEQVSRYFLSAKQLEESLTGEDDALLKFALIRPHLDEAMIQENWKAAEALFSLVQWSDLLAIKALDVSGKLSIEISNYAEVISNVTILARGEKDAKALADVAYFLYENHIAPRCGYERPSLIQEHLSSCDAGYIVPTDKGMVRAKSRNVKEIRAPIEMFAGALDVYKGQEGFQAEEARLLRVMIYCAKGAKNVAYCLRWKKIPKASFKSWFEDLNLHYDKKEHVQYWFYDLPDNSTLSEASDEFMETEQQYWYDDDAYVGYLDGGPYSLDINE